jgi:phenylacetate-CoA ligase
MAATVRGNLPAIAWPPIHVGRAGALANLVAMLDETQWLSPDEVVAAQFSQFGLLARTLASTSSGFRARLARAGIAPGDAGSPDALARIPPLTRQEVADRDPGLFASAVPQHHMPITIGKTSGSTGAPLAVPRTAVTALVWDALTIRDHLWRDVDFRGRILANRQSLTGTVEQRDWGPPTSLLYDSGRLQAVPLVTSIDDLAARIAAFAPEVLLLRPSVLDELLLHYLREGRRPTSLRFVHTYGEPLRPQLRVDAAEALQVNLWDTYSCEEIGNLAASCPQGDGYHVLAEGALVEVLDEDDRPCAVGDIGRIVVTDLHNLAAPMVRYDIGDYAEVVAPCACGRGLPTLGRVVGRERNRVRLPDGGWRWPAVPTLARLQQAAPVRQLRLVQQPTGEIEVEAVVFASVTSGQEAAMADLLHAALGHDFPLRFGWQSRSLERTSGGKFETFLRRDRV